MKYIAAFSSRIA